MPQMVEFIAAMPTNVERMNMTSLKIANALRRTGDLHEILDDTIKFCGRYLRLNSKLMYVEIKVRMLTMIGPMKTPIHPRVR